MKISELNLDDYVIVNDLGASKYSSGMRVIGRVVGIDDNHNHAIIESLPNHRYEITDFNDFELWAKNIEDKTESVSVPRPGQKFYFDNNDLDPHNLFEIKIQSNDLQQRKRKDTVNHPSHYNYGEIEIIDVIEQVTKHYNPNVAYHIGNAIKYLSRSPHNNGKEDVAKAKWYIERAFEVWDN